MLFEEEMYPISELVMDGDTVSLHVQHPVAQILNFNEVRFKTADGIVFTVDVASTDGAVLVLNARPDELARIPADAQIKIQYIKAQGGTHD